MDLVYVGGVYGGCEGAEEDGGGGEGGGDGVCVETILLVVSFCMFLIDGIVRKGAYERTSFGSPYFEYTSALACVYPYGPDLCLRQTIGPYRGLNVLGRTPIELPPARIHRGSDIVCGVRKYLGEKSGILESFDIR